MEGTGLVEVDVVLDGSLFGIVLRLFQANWFIWTGWIVICLVDRNW